MGRIVFAEPGIARFHLHDRLGRELVQRGHQVDALSLDPVAHTFWRAQVQPAVRVRPTRPGTMNAPFVALAAAECTRRGLDVTGAAGRQEQRRLERQLTRLLPAVLDWLGQQRPQLVLLHGDRSAHHGLLHFAARQLGIATLWTGDGLLPGTMQFDDRGLDADSRAAAREPWEYRDDPSDPALLRASLAHALSGARPFGLARSEIAAPACAHRVGDAIAALPRGWRAARHAMRGWRAALGCARPLQRHDLALRKPQFVAVLLQSPSDERQRLDAVPAAPVELVDAAVHAASTAPVGYGDLATVVVAPPDGLAPQTFADLRRHPSVEVVAARHAHTVAASAVATVSVNHPAATTGLLAGTPALHTGRALFALPGVTHTGPPDRLAALLQQALGAAPATTLRERFLTRLIAHHHVWCDPDEPDHNGLQGLVRIIEASLQMPAPPELTTRYRQGPAWPLSVSDEP